MASIQCKIDSKGKNRYYVVFQDPSTGKQKWKSAGLRKEDAELMLCEIVAELMKSKPQRSSRIRFSEYCALWLTIYAKPHYKPSTYATTVQRIRGQLMPFFGRLSLSSISPGSIQEYIEYRINRGSSASTITRDIAPLKTMLSCAYKWGYIRTNPCAGLKCPKPRRKHFTLLSPDELSRLFNAADEPYRTIFMVAAFAGMRRSELLALSWADIDWVADEVYINKMAYRGVTAPLEAALPRRIPLAPVLKEALIEYKKRYPGNLEDPIFIHPDGRKIDANNLTRRTFKRALRKAGLPDIRFCDLRHTYASLLIHQGVGIATVQRYLGHASMKTTLDTYGHIIKDGGS
ncbi:MAG TPA: tyrosine-type recombinase/integrase [Anaerolineae bacterium]|nr:tyrosine-type recombinase/integrase [Anaerolineae bacterium]